MPKFEINNLTKSKVNEIFLKKIVNELFKILKTEKPEEISLVIIGAAKIRGLNKNYRKKNKVTDVLAFDYGKQGEIFICLPQAKKQAKKLNHSLNKELSILLIHGILHLMGYEDKTKKGYNKMVEVQNKILDKMHGS